MNNKRYEIVIHYPTNDNAIAIVSKDHDDIVLFVNTCDVRNLEQNLPRRRGYIEAAKLDPGV